MILMQAVGTTVSTHYVAWTLPAAIGHYISDNCTLHHVFPNPVHS